MINTHKEFIGEIENFANKMELINEFKYIKDTDTTLDVLMNSEPRVFLIGLNDLTMTDEDYNMTLSYNFAISDEVLFDDDAILNSESENMFVVSALYDYLNHIKDIEVNFNTSTFSLERTNESVFTAVTGSFDFVIKRSASYWKQMEAYSVNE